ncbi:dna binding hth domain arac-type [Desulfoluna butyratoxydans]|uniref:Dna binding hth domain arac-type n=2 Tax=Desulfoluna butyratoxydans TaxID=231438 RepID=A0A4U8YQX5_9BACT|nr:dna binding hth domain arac-type [Desulfoluna butyratoxydans]
MEREMLQQRSEDGAAFLFSDYRKTSEASPYGEIASSMAGLSEEYASYEVIPIRRGLHVTVSRFSARRPLVLDFEIAGAPIDFEYWLSGAGQCRMQGMNPAPSVFRSSAGAANASYAPNTSGRCEAVGDTDICIVGLSVDPSLLYSLVGEDASCLPPRFRPIAEGEGRDKDKFSVTGSLPPAMQAACHQILSCPFDGECRELFLESKALELLCLQVNALAPAHREIGRPFAPHETDRIHSARDSLVADLKNPPSIATLARQTGINETKLKEGFRRVYGTTVFGYLRRHKMEVARAFLEAGEKNVSEAAYDVGYVNVSHFICAYRKAFGVNPGEVARQCRAVF